PPVVGSDAGAIQPARAVDEAVGEDVAFFRLQIGIGDLERGDLVVALLERAVGGYAGAGGGIAAGVAVARIGIVVGAGHRRCVQVRSEERRVGKEGTTRQSPKQRKTRTT